MKEADVVGPHGEYREPGPWLLDLLRIWDKTKGGSVDPGFADREYLKKLDADEARAELERENRQREISLNSATEMAKYAFGRHSVHVNRETA